MQRKIMYKLITCIASEDKVRDAALGLNKEFGIQAMVNNFARGFGRSSPLATRGLGQQTEKVIISVLVPKKQVDEVFAYIYHTADLERPHGGIIYVTAVNKPVISPNVEFPNKDESVE